MRTVVLSLPTKPISLSECFINSPRAGRVKSKKYKAWILENTLHLKTKHPESLGRKDKAACMGWVSVNIIIQKPDNRKSDLDNKCKAILDLITSLGVIEDDSKIAELSLRWSFFKDVAPVAIVVKELAI